MKKVNGFIEIFLREYFTTSFVVGSLDISVNKTYFQCNLNVLILKFKMHFLNSAIFERLNCFVNEF